MLRRAIPAALAVAALGTPLFGPAAAQAVDPPRAAGPGEPTRGAVLFRLHCAACHGADGRGDGPIAKDLKAPPPDLSRIAARRGGRFSAEEVERLVDGRTEIGAHGSSEMPVWGLSFQQPGRLEDQEEEIWLQIRQLVRHLRSIQTGPVVEEG